MAAQKKKTGRSPVKRTTSSRTKTSARGRRSETKPKAEAEASEVVSPEEGRHQINAVIMFSVAAFLMCVALIPGPSLWKFLRSILFGFMGGAGGIVFPIILIVLSVIGALEKHKTPVSQLLLYCLAVLLMVNSIIYIFSRNPESGYFASIIESFKSGNALSNGGVFGAIIGGLLWLLFGKTGAFITAGIALFASVMIITRTSLKKLFRMIASAPQSIENAKQQVRSGFGNEYGNGDGYDGFEDFDDFPPELDAEYTDAPAQKKRRPQRKRLSVSSDDPDIDYYGETDDEAQEAERAQEENRPKIDDIIKKVARTSADKEDDKAVIQHEEKREKPKVGYVKPPLSLLNQNKSMGNGDISDELKSNATLLVDTLRSFGVETRIIDISRGPAVTRYELQPSAGVKISRITGLVDDIALNLASAGVRIEAPIPNKAAVGIEVPNKNKSIVTMREVLEDPAFRNARSKLTVALGKDIAGDTVVADLSKMPHLLIAGQTGSGKSVCINSIIISILYNATPDEVKLIMIDPKVVELGIYNGIPHLEVPVVTDPQKAAGTLCWAVTEMLNRYKLFAASGVREIGAYNKLCASTPDMQPMARYLIIIDELADLMAVAPNEVEDAICRLAQMARAAGMHLVIATQRPSTDVITGTIKANIPSRIAFSVVSQIDSRTILDKAGAEKLLGMGDMLFMPVGASKPTRIQGCFVSDEEVEDVVTAIKKNHEADYNEDVIKEIDKHAVQDKKKGGSSSQDSDEFEDEMLPKAIECVVDAGIASTTLLQRKLRLGYARAARLIDELEARGVVGPFEGSKPRSVLMTKIQWLEMQAKAASGEPDEEHGLPEDEDFEF